MNYVSVSVGYIVEMQKCRNVVEMYLIQSKNGIMINVNAKVKNWLIWVLVKIVIHRILVHVIVNVTVCEIGEYLVIKNCESKARPIYKLVLSC